jgi:ribulose-phosphate 3-epimerase
VWFGSFNLPLQSACFQRLFAKKFNPMARLIAPSVLSADFGNLQRDIEMINASNADWFHVDVMDGEFVPNISFGFPVIKALQKHAKKPLDVHLMIVQPDRYIQAFKECGADVLTVHYEACTHLHRTIQAIKAEGMKAGVAINPHTNVNVLEDILMDVDLILIMSVNPGFGGQKFIERTLDKVKAVSQMRESSGASFLIEVDGGVSDLNANKLFEAGADVLVAGNYVFAHPNPMAAIDAIK